MFRENDDNIREINSLKSDKVGQIQLINDLEERIQRLTDQNSNTLASKNKNKQNDFNEIQKLKREYEEAKAESEKEFQQQC